MPITEECARKIAEAMKAEWDLYVNIETQWPLWRSRIAEVCRSDQEALESYTTFRRSWQSADKPSLRSFISFVREHKAPQCAAMADQRDPADVKRAHDMAEAVFNRLRRRGYRVGKREGAVPDVSEDEIPF